MSKVRFVAVMVGLACLLAMPSAAYATKFAPPAINPSFGDANLRANALVSGDFNGDFFDDIAAGSQGNGVQIRLSSPSGWVTAPTALPYSGGAYSLATGDFNGDNDDDLVFAGYACSGPSCPPDPAVLLSNGDGTFGAPIGINSNLNSPAGWNAISVGDADSDGNLDVIIGMGLGQFGISYGNGSGGFTLAQRTDIPGAPHGFDDDAISNTVADFNGDGDNDLAFAIRNHTDLSHSAVYLLLGDGARSYAPSANNPFPVGQPAGYIDSIKSADFNQDGNADLAATLSGEGQAPPSTKDGSIQVWNGDDEEDMVANPLATILVQSQNPQAPNPDRVGPSNLRVGDFDGDGKSDLAWFEYFQPNGPWEYRFVVARNTGSTFVPEGPWTFPNASGNPLGLAVGNFNSDGAPDVAMSSWGNGQSGGLFFLQNKADLGVDRSTVQFGEVKKSDVGTAFEEIAIQHRGGPSASTNLVYFEDGDGSFVLENSCGGRFIQNASCIQKINLDPFTTVGTHTATLVVTFNDGYPDIRVPISATVTVPKASFSPGHLDFGNLRNGQQRTMTVTATNTGSASLVFMDDGYVDGSAAGRFQIMDDDCSGNLIAPNDACDVTIKATANATGPVTAAELKLINDGYLSPQGVSLSFTGINPGVNTVPSSADFGSVQIGDEETQFFNIESTGTTGLEITDLEVESTNAGDFAIAGPGCLGVYAPNSECQFQVVYQPKPGGGTVRTGQIQFQTNASDNVTVIPIQGTATQAIADLTVDDLPFGAAPIGKDVSQTVTVKSVGDAALDIEEAWVDGPNDEDNERFSVSEDTCTGSSVAPAQTCSYKVTFNPDERRDYLAYTGVYGNNFDEMLEVTGNGTQPAAGFAKSSRDFGEAAIGGSGTRPQHVFELTSTGMDPVDVDALAVTGTDAADFSLATHDACLTVLPVGQSCQATVTFDPKIGNPGPRTAKLVASTNGGDVEVVLTGSAVTASTPAKARVKIKAPKKVKVKKKTRIKVKVTVTNTGATVISGAKLGFSAKQGKKGKANVSKRVALPRVPAGKSIRKTITINLRKAQLKRGKPALKLEFSVIHQGKSIAVGRGTVRLDFGQVKADRR